MRLSLGQVAVLAILALLIFGVGGIALGDLISIPGSNGGFVALCCVFPMAVYCTWWTYNDAQERRKPALLWALVTFLGVFPIGFLVYLFVGRN